MASQNNIFTEEQNKQLQEMIRENNTQDNTEYIKKMKHSKQIRKDVAFIQNLKRNNRNADFKTLDNEATHKCNFLFVNYPNIYNKLLKNQINIKILYSFLDELESIENGKQTQHEASYKIGMLLKQLYVDKTLSEPQETQQQPKKNTIKPRKVSYEEYKKSLNKN